MKQKIIVILIGISLFACNFLFPPSEMSAATEPASPSIDSQDPQPTEFTIVRLRPQDGDLPTMLSEHAQKATALGQMPVVEFDATWCGPCKAIDAAIKSKNELMLKAYAGTYIIKLDADEWGWGDSRKHDFEFEGVPVYFKLDAEGHQTGDVVDGNAWGENIPENIAPVMDKFFHGEP